MSYEDKTLECVECGANFNFSAAEQEFFASKGFTNEPKRCPQCREARKQQRYGGQGNREGTGYQPRRQMHTAICATCGKETEVPFEPRDGRPVYCWECFAKVKQSPTSKDKTARRDYPV